MQETRFEDSQIDVVVPSMGRPSLRRLLDSLGPQRARLGSVLVVDDSHPGGSTLSRELAGLATVVPGDGRGPAAARNAGWRASRAGWIAFLDNDVVPGPSWAEDLV